MSRPPIVLLLVFAGLAFTCATFLVSDTDVFWVAAAGRWMLEHHAVPHENLWSITEPSHPWVFHEWLFGVPFAGLLEHGGVGLLPLVTLAMATIVAGLFFHFTRHRPWLAALGLVCFSMRLVTPRPSHLALIFPLWLWWLVDGPLTRRRAALVLLVEWLWANSHGSFVLGWALLALKVLEDRAQRARWAGLLAGAVAITFINPYGVALHSLVAEYLLGLGDAGAVIHQHIREFQPMWREPDFLYSRATLAMVLAAGVAVRGLLKPVARWRSLLVLALVAQAVLHVRHRELAGLLSWVLLLPMWPSKPGSTAYPVWQLLVPGVLVGALCWGWQWSQHRTDESWVSKELGGADVVTLARALPDDARVSTEFSASGVVLWYGAHRGVTVLMDARNDCYSAATAQVFFAIADGEAPLSRLAENRVTHVLVKNSSTMAALPAETTSGEWAIRRVP